MIDEELFHLAREMPEPERTAFLDEACAADRAQRKRVEDLLKSDENPDSFLAGHARGVSLLGDESSGATEAGFVKTAETAPEARLVTPAKPTVQIGPYRLLQQIGEGGMGTVYMAEQVRPVRRRVALKVIKPGMDSRQVIARFEAERQALALMDHVNIARVLDAGTTDQGRPYFVMELVQGVPITRYCDDKQLTPRQRLELFVPVCQAVQHAHQKGIIHRDIKPSNVMVTMYDGRPVPKVIDFGVAKAIDQNLTERTLFTQFGTMIGTLEYMSPEQAEMSALGVDTRSDIYSLGVLLYELLTGSTPLGRERMRQAAYGEIVRLIKEEEPARPSTRLSDSGAELASISALRKTEPAKLTKLVRGEIDWIVMRSLEKDRNRRYETANGFAADVQRYLNDEPVLACPPSVGYRLRKSLRRNRGPAFAAGLVLLALIAGVTGTTIGLIRADRARRSEADQRRLAERNERAALAATASETLAKQDAEAREKETQAILKFVQDRVFSAASPEGEQGGLGRDVTLRRAVEVAVPFIETSFKQQPRAEARLRHSIGLALYNLGEPGKAAEQFDKVRELNRRFLGPLHRETLSVSFNLANCYRELGRLREALTLYEETWRKLSAELGPDDFLTLRCAHAVADGYASFNRISEALTLGERTLKLAQERYGPNHECSIEAMWSHANNFEKCNRDEEALKLRTEVLALSRATYGPRGRSTLVAMHNLANSLSALGRKAEAVELYEESLAVIEDKLGPEHPDTLMTLNSLARCYSALGRHADGERLSIRVLEAQKKRLGPNNPKTLNDAAHLAHRWISLGRHAEALALAQETLARQKANPDVERMDLLYSMWVVATCLERLDRGDEALRVIDEYLERLGDFPDNPSHMKMMLEIRLSIFRKLRQAPGFRSTIDRWEKLALKDPMSLFNTACHRAFLATLIRNDPENKEDAERLAREEDDKAMVWLNRAMDAGWDNFEHMSADTDIASLRERADYRALFSGERARASFARLLKVLPPERGSSTRRKKVCLQIAASDELFRHFLESDPNDPQLWIGRGRHCINQGRLDEAAEAYARVIDRHPLDDEHFEYACLLLKLGRRDEFEAFLRRIAAKFGETRDRFENYVLARTMSIVAQSAVPASAAVNWGKQACIDPRAWYLQALSLALYRNGQFQEAIDRAKESDTHGWHAEGRSATALVRAMAQMKLGLVDEARKSLAEGRKPFEPYPPPTKAGLHLTEWISVRLILDEAIAAIEPRPKTADPPGESSETPGSDRGLKPK